LSVQQVALLCVCVCLCECVCCVWDSLDQVWRIECAAGGFVVCVFVCVLVCVCAACMCVCVRRVGQFGAVLGDGVCSKWLCGLCVCVYL